MSNSNKLQLLYSLEEKPESIKDIIIYSLQWVLIMFYPVVWGYAIVGVGLGFTGADLASYMGRIVLIIGLSTLLQTIFGSRMSMISGPNIIPSLAIVSAMAIGGKEYALLSFNAFIISGIIIALIGAFGLVSYMEKIWTQLALGAMVMMVGLSTSFTGLELIATYDASWPFIVGILLALLAGYLSIRGKGMIANIPVLITIVTGYLIFIISGEFDWSLVNSMPVFVLPTVFPYGFEFPPVDLIITMFVVTMFSAVNVYGNIGGYANIIGEKVTLKQEKKTFTILGIVETSIAGIFGVPPHAVYGENLGFVLLIKIASRLLIIIASIVFIVLSFLGKVSGLMAAMPEPVAGAVLLGVASTLIGIGVDTIKSPDASYETREIFIVGFSIFLALGVSQLPQSFFDTLPRLLATLLNNPVIFVIALVIILEQIVFRKKV